MKEKITLYKQIDSYGHVHTNAIKLQGYEVLASVEVEVEFKESDNREIQRKAIRQAINTAKQKHEQELSALAQKLETV